MTDLTIKTDHKARDILYWHELTPKEQREFDYLDSEEKQQDASFFRYRDECYDLGEFMRTDALGSPPPFKTWDGYLSDSYFSGVLVKFVDDNERIIVATYYS